MNNPPKFRVAAAMAACMAVTGCPQDTPTAKPSPLAAQSSPFTGPPGGCGNFSVHRFNQDGTWAIAVIVDEAKIKLTDQPLTLDIASDPENLHVEALQFDAPTEAYFCDDVAGDAEPTQNWQAVSGKVIVERHAGTPSQGHSGATHRVSVVLRNVRLKNSRTGGILEFLEVRIPDVWVGWLAG